MRRVIFHLGPEKTGSTLIQNFLELNANLVTDESGKAIKYHGPDVVRSSGLLAESQSVILTETGDLSALKLLLNVDADTVIVSHESLFGNPDMAGFYGSRGGRRRLVSLLARGSGPDRVADFVFYYKHPARLIESYYRHHIVEDGGTAEPTEYLKWVPLLEMSFLSFRDDIVKIAGEDHVKMLDAMIVEPVDFFTRFCRAAGLYADAGKLIPPEYTNRTLSSDKIEITRAANSKISAADRPKWIEFMHSMALENDFDLPLIPTVVTALISHIYHEEDAALRKLLDDSTAK